MNDIPIKEIRAKLGLSQKKLAEKLGVHWRTVQNWESNGGISYEDYTKICALLPDDGCKIADYYGGETDMQDEYDKKYQLPLIPIEAVAGFPSVDEPGVGIPQCEMYNVPEFTSIGAQYLIRVSGDSMYPRYSNGDILACRKVTSITFFQWGMVYVLDTVQGALVKRLFECKDDDTCVVCHSDNADKYPRFKLPKSEIRTLSIVVGVIRLE